jgi:hypothetical protein
MTTITLDTKNFDYSKITEGLVAVPKSVLKEYLKFKNKEQIKISLSEINDTEYFSPEWILSNSDIVKSKKIALKEFKEGKLTTL